MSAGDSLARRALVTTTTRIINQGLIIISPIFLVHLLSVEAFGRYREFLLYAGILITTAGLGFYNSLLYFLPARPEQGRRFVIQSILMTAGNSLVVAAGALVYDAVFPGKLLGGDAWMLAVYVLLFVNVDCWEYLWLAKRRNVAVLVYTSGRLIARMVVVVASAALTGDVRTMVMALIALEAVRLVASALALPRTLRGLDEGTDERRGVTWREQWQFCLPVGVASLLSSFNRSAGGLFVVTLLGPTALAYYAVGTYVQPLINVFRNSISDVMLPHMVAEHSVGGERSRPGSTDSLAVWRRSTVVFAMLLLPAGVLLARYAEQIVITVFNAEYVPAIAIFQIFMLVLIRECFDFSVPLRVLGMTRPILASNSLALGLHAVLLAVLLPRFGLIGAVWGFVFSRYVEGAFLGARMMSAWHLTLLTLAPWKDLAMVFAATLVAVPLLWAGQWVQWFGITGVAVGSLVYLAAYALLLRILKVPEALTLLKRVRTGAFFRLPKEAVR